MSDSIQIKIISVEQETHKTQKGSYDSLEVTYKNLTFQDKVEAKKIMSFNHKEVFNTLKSANNGAIYTVQRAKNDKGYWDWTALGDDAPAANNSTGGKTMTSPKSTYETPEERAKKQVYIVRQSSINAAIETLKTDKKNPSVAEVLEVAKQFETYVFGAEPKAGIQAALPRNPDADDDEDVPY